ncbi:MAG: heavy-metal-associated domain-containing protein [Roseococcus sp.]|jgi:copper chaperone|nr:heavy-metal-associated domain-containing protein [Roseococcus sp.]
MLHMTIANMHCGGCAKGVRASLSEVAPGVTVEINLERRQASLDVPDAAPVLAKLRSDGWEAMPIADQTMTAPT